jgi:hypothetical protein
MVELEDRKGQLICVAGAVYRGCNAWLDTVKGPTKKMVYLIVEYEEDCLKVVRVSKENVRAVPAPADNYAEGAVRQHTDLDEAIDKMARKFALCGLQGTDEVLHIVKTRVDDAMGKQIRLGGKAVWRKVEFDQNV